MVNVELLKFFLFIILSIVIIILFRLRSFIFAWFSVLRSFGSKILVRVRNPGMDYFVSGRVDKAFLYFKGRKRSDNTSPNRVISITHIFNPETGKFDKEFNFREAVYKCFGVECVDVDDEKDTIIFYRQGMYHFVPGTNTELFDEINKTALAKPSREEGLMNSRLWQIIVLVGLVLLIIGLIIIYNQGRTVDSHIKLVYDQVVLNNNIINASIFK